MVVDSDMTLLMEQQSSAAACCNLANQVRILEAENQRLKLSNEALSSQVKGLHDMLATDLDKIFLTANTSSPSSDRRDDGDSSESILLTVMRKSSVYMSYCDADLRYVWIKHFLGGFSSQEMYGRLDEDIFPSKTLGLKEFVGLKQKALDTRKAQSGYIEFSLPNCQLMTWLVATEAFFCHTGDPVGVLTVCIKVTAQPGTNQLLNDKSTETHLREAVKLAEEAIRAKNMFLAIMSHEIRTPLNGLLGLAEALEFSGLSKEQQELLKAVVSSGTIIADILGDILDLSSMESGAMQLDAQPFNPSDIVQEIVKMAIAATHEKRIRIESYIGLDVPHMVVGDALRVRQIMKYLVLNAIKFTQNGSVEIRIDSKNIPQHLKNILLWCQVSDTGIGIPKEVFPSLFNQFSQADSSTTRSYGGTGLGLALCKQLVELMGGELNVESEVGKGSCFTFTVACKCYLKEENEIEEEKEEKKNKKKSVNESESENENQREPRILLAEDNKVNVMVAISMLKRLGFTAQVVANGVEALEAMRKEKYDLVLLDICMPLMDGLQVAYAIRKYEKTGRWISDGEEEAKEEGRELGMGRSMGVDMGMGMGMGMDSSTSHRRIPIIAVTANALRSDVDKCYAYGMDAFISKPVIFHKFRETLERYLPLQHHS